MSEINPLCLTSQVTVRDGILRKNGIEIYRQLPGDLEKWLTEAYRESGMNYPKFHKMDPLSRLGVLMTEHLTEGACLQDRYSPYEIGLIMTNAHASLDTDIRYARSMQQNASPALFVYTLPNIMMGEICIKNNFKGYNAFFIFDRYNPGFLYQQVMRQMRVGEEKVFLCGWAEVLLNHVEAAFFLVEPETERRGTPFTPANLEF
jgi:hypothetical protein